MLPGTKIFAAVGTLVTAGSVAGGIVSYKILNSKGTSEEKKEKQVSKPIEESDLEDGEELISQFVSQEKDKEGRICERQVKKKILSEKENDEEEQYIKKYRNCSEDLGDDFGAGIWVRSSETKVKESLDFWELNPFESSEKWELNDNKWNVKGKLDHSNFQCQKQPPKEVLERVGNGKKWVDIKCVIDS